MSSSLLSQVQRLKHAAFPLDAIVSASLKIMNKVRKGPAKPLDDKRGKGNELAVIPYIHGLSHRIKKIAHKFNIDVHFSAKNKLNTLCARIDKLSSGASGHSIKNQENLFPT